MEINKDVVYFELNNWFSGRDYPNAEPFLTWICENKFSNDEWLKENKLVSELSSLEEDIQIIGSSHVLLKKVENMDISSLKQVMDNLANQYTNIFILIANITNDNVTFLARNNNPLMNAGTIVKNASVKSLGNGGGSNKFAQGSGKTIKEINNIFNDVIKEIENE